MLYLGFAMAVICAVLLGLWLMVNLLFRMTVFSWGWY